MDKLNYSDLDAVRNASPPNLALAWLEVTDVDIKRLRDDRSAIQPGDEVAFVATASFRVTQAGLTALKQGGASMFDNACAGNELLVIGADAELRSELVPIDEDSVALWLADRYQFTFLLNGREHGPFDDLGHVRVTTDSPASHAPRLALPWIRTLDTAAITDDYIDVDVRITERTPPQAPPPSVQPLVWTIDAAGGGAAKLSASLEIELSHAAASRVAGRSFRVPLAGCDDEVQLAIKFDSKAGVLDDKPGEDALRVAPPGRTTDPPPHATAHRTRNRDR